MKKKKHKKIQAFKSFTFDHVLIYTRLNEYKNMIGGGLSNCNRDIV